MRLFIKIVQDSIFSLSRSVSSLNVARSNSSEMNFEKQIIFLNSLRISIHHFPTLIEFHNNWKWFHLQNESWNCDVESI